MITFNLTKEQVKQVYQALFLACETQDIDDVLYEMFEKAAQESRRACPSCQGSGEEMDFGGFPQACPVCLGTGTIK